MIKLSTPFVTSTAATLNGQTTTTTTDTLFVAQVILNFKTGVVKASIQRGTTNASGAFTANLPDIWVTVQSNGNFASADGSWKGSLGATFLAGLAAAFDNAVLAANLVQGSEIAGSL